MKDMEQIDQPLSKILFPMYTINKKIVKLLINGIILIFPEKIVLFFEK